MSTERPQHGYLDHDSDVGHLARVTDPLGVLLERDVPHVAEVDRVRCVTAREFENNQPTMPESCETCPTAAEKSVSKLLSRRVFGACLGAGNRSASVGCSPWSGQEHGGQTAPDTATASPETNTTSHSCFVEGGVTLSPRR